MSFTMPRLPKQMKTIITMLERNNLHPQCSLLMRSKHQGLICFKCFVWIGWWWLLGKRNMLQCTVSFIKLSCIWLTHCYCYFRWVLMCSMHTSILNSHSSVYRFHTGKNFFIVITTIILSITMVNIIIFLFPPKLHVL